MKGVVLVSLLAVATCSPQIWNNYDSLNEHLKKHIDKAIIKANKEFSAEGKHMNFVKIEGPPTVTSHHHNVRVRLRPTTCAAANTESEIRQRNDCEFPSRVTMVIDCVVCKQHDGQELVHCVKLRHLENPETTKIRERCAVHYNPGESVILAMKTNSYDQQTGCIGCV